VKDGQLYIEDCSVVSLAEEFGTPVFVVSENHLRHNFRLYQEEFSRHWPEGPVRIMPSIKASPLIAVRQILSDEGAGCDVFGPGELEAAVRGGVSPELISVNGSIKDRTIIRRAVNLGARIVLDSPRELELCEQEAARANTSVRVMFRLKPRLDDLDVMSDYVPDISILKMTQLIKYGIPTSELMEMASRVTQLKHVDLVGVHVHMGRHSKHLNVWKSWVENTIRLTAELSRALGGWQPQEINFGGGLPSFPDDDTDVTVKGYPGPTLTELAECLTSSARAAMIEHGLNRDGVIFEVEPGRGIHCDTGIHLTTVRNLKTEANGERHNWTEIDTSQMFLGVGGANFDGPKFEFIAAGKVDEPRTVTTDIVGLTCNLEILFYQVSAPAFEVGDVIALLNTGSYIEPCTQNFNALPRPGTVLVSGDQVDIIKRHESVDDVFARDSVPERLTRAVAARRVV
jgi:diaminopimelate decarboxylase